MDEIRFKGLCLNCDELFPRGQECKKLFWIDFIDDEEEFAEKETAEGIQALIMHTKIKERKILVELSCKGVHNIRVSSNIK
uniref:Putative ovule protein n=1 Tax=Solanum chacoense TaxID=4108 RepID=A0A0V0I4C4_SOLCH